ncbi:FHA domain-containing protein [Cesiribacter sp. SM1]|uniref:FHA domain-containing protein n=1 Tax=Cesiribacter sp. SM1 TaxID=2861196 RepID=UPI001CD7A4EE|nr:FHA domain-containing protein [Cesiribacter sp. SM1]
MAWSTLKKSADNKHVANGRAVEKQQPTAPYTLVFLDSAKNLPEGTEQKMDASYVSLGRDNDCMVCYGEEFPMVSRFHAAIEWSEDSYSIRHLSTTNQTLLNGRPIARKWFLHDDDVIQLAPSGPKIKFKMPLVLSTQSSEKSKKDYYNIAMITLVVLAVLLVAFMVYMTITSA